MEKSLERLPAAIKADIVDINTCLFEVLENLTYNPATSIQDSKNLIIRALKRLPINNGDRIAQFC